MTKFHRVAQVVEDLITLNVIAGNDVRCAPYGISQLTVLIMVSSSNTLKYGLVKYAFHQEFFNEIANGAVDITESPISIQFTIA